MAKTRTRLTKTQIAKLWNAVAALKTKLESDMLAPDLVYSMVSEKLDFEPPSSAVRSMITECGIEMKVKPVEKSDAKMLSEIVGLALTRLAKGTPHMGVVTPVATKLADGDVKGAYDSRGPLVF